MLMQLHDFAIEGVLTVLGFATRSPVCMRQVPCTPCSAALEAEMAQRTTVAGVPDERSIEMLASQVCHKHANVCSTTQYPNRVFNPDSRNIVLVSCGVGCFKGLVFLQTLVLLFFFVSMCSCLLTRVQKSSLVL